MLTGTLAITLAGCSAFSGMFAKDNVDYGTQPVKAKPLDVPPDLSQLAPDSRYQVQGGVVSAVGAKGVAPAASGSAPAPTVALNRDDGMRIERDGQSRWLVVPRKTPEELWPRVESFWTDGGFKLATEDPKVGVMDTDWLENKAKAPGTLVRNLLGDLLQNVFDSGQRDAYRTRIERTPTGSEIYISQRGIEEVYLSDKTYQQDQTTWRARPNDPQLEAVMLSRLMLALGGDAETAAGTPAGTGETLAAAATQATQAASAASGAARAGAVPQSTTLVLDEPFDRSWRRVGLALDRGGFTVEDRDRAAGLYYVRYVDPKNAGKEDPGWWARLWGDNSHPQEALRYQILLKPVGEKTQLSVRNSAGAFDNSENARRIAQLLNEGLQQ
jgi:outer membrane protein assembly factor BamC